MSEANIAAAAAKELARMLAELYGSEARAYVRVTFFLGGMLFPQRQPADLVLDQLLDTFKRNAISHLLLIKHFPCVLPPSVCSRTARELTDGSTLGVESSTDGTNLAKWVHISARVGSYSANKLLGWYLYRTSKAALNQVTRTFDLDMQVKRCVGV